MTETASPGNGGKNGNPARAKYVVPRCGDLRTGKGLTKSKLSDLAEVDTTTISKIERKEAVSIETAMKIYNALNGLHGGALQKDKEVLKIDAADER